MTLNASRETLKKIIKELTWQARSLVSQKNIPCKFIIVGAQKAGTTSLYDYMTLHPQIESAYEKEIHYFSKYYKKSKAWYRAHFKKRADDAPYENILTGEASPYYLYHPLSANRIKSFDADMKIIIILRDPVERAYSHYHHQIRGETESLSFSEAIAAEDKRLAGKDDWIKKTNQHSPEHQRYSYKKRGEYLEQIKRFHDHFPRENIIILNSKNLFSEPLICLNTVWGFLGLENYIPTGELKARNIGGYQIPDEDKKTIRMLKEYYKPLNDELFAYIKKDFGWNNEGV